MILKKDTLKRLIQSGDADYTGGTEQDSIVVDNGVKYVSVNRLDIQRTDHYQID